MTGLSILIIFICVALDMSLIATLIVSAAIPAIAALIAFLALLDLTFMGADCGSWGRSWNWLTAREAVWDAVFLPASAAAIVWTCLLYIEMLRVGMSAYYGIPCVLVVLAAGIGAGIRIEWYSHNTGATRALIAASLIGEVTVLVLALIRFA